MYRITFKNDTVKDFQANQITNEADMVTLISEDPNSQRLPVLIGIINFSEVRMIEQVSLPEDANLAGGETPPVS